LRRHFTRSITPITTSADSEKYPEQRSAFIGRIVCVVVLLCGEARLHDVFSDSPLVGAV
jgi:hypothetical protein